MMNVTLNDLHSLATIEPPRIQERWHYMVRYFATSIPSIVRPHQLRLSETLPSYQSRFRITKEDKQAWYQLFGADEGVYEVPFTYMTTAGTLMLMQILADTGVNFRHLLHLKNQMTLHKPCALGRVRETYRIAVRLSDVAIVRHDRVGLIVETQVTDIVGRLLASYTDTFLIMQVPAEDIALLQEHPQLSHEDGGKLTKRPTADWDALAEGRTSAVDLPDGIGLTYGKLSGDLNLVHTTRLAAKLFGYPNAFVQGFFLTNQVLQAVTAANGRPPHQLSIHFARPAYTGQTIQLHHNDGQFAYKDARGKLIAAGECRM